jgi:ABC-type phosphate/phosphonate transport system permease subunit
MGQLLTKPLANLHDFNDREAATVILLIVGMVICVAILSARIRRAII